MLVMKHLLATHRALELTSIQHLQSVNKHLLQTYSRQSCRVLVCIQTHGVWNRIEGGEMNPNTHN